MKKLILLGCVLLTVSTALAAHKYYFSVSEIKYNVQNESVEIITRIFYDDLEKTMQTRYDADFKIGGGYPEDKRIALLQRYFDQKLRIKVNGKPVKLKFLGLKTEQDYAVNFAEIKNVPSIKSIEVVNTLLRDLFENQKNVIHLEIGGNRKSFLLITENDKAVLNL
ncbi:MAG: DUF6702 family protein [Leeuwenhoekiella sp.]